ncbi:CQS_1a_G0017520.mRNA.1.CDS.1 [Saccharomyces cerevisiae]|nr:CQS_1a_G0017520.mRNA.1.CDS.1 [Saccharomyces cerevisiae]CAI7279211.1 CQS_1a_G0017520.mRNA.1.CDS.1 [Saccharomyces cerevisiae]
MSKKKKKEKIRRSMKNLCRFVESYKDFTLYGYRFHSKIKHKFCVLSSSFPVLFFCHPLSPLKSNFIDRFTLDSHASQATWTLYMVVIINNEPFPSADSASILTTSTSNNSLMSYNHQPQLSINSVQSLLEPVTPPPLGQMNNKRNHQKAHSLDLSGFNQFISSTQSPLALMNNTSTSNSANSFSPNPNAASNTTGLSASMANPPAILPLINEFDLEMDGPRRKSSHDFTVVAPSNSGVNTSSLIMETPSSSVTPAASLRNFSNSNNAASKCGVDNSSFGLSSSTSSSMVEISALPLRDLDYIKLATDQFGCRFLQKKLETPSESNMVRDLMYEQIKPFFLDLILDPFGNYLVQKLCDYLTAEQKTLLIQTIYPNVFQISINQYGTRSLQKIIDTVDNEVQIDLIIKGFSQEFTSIEQVVTLINDLNGNHVIQKCIFKFSPSKFGFIIDAIVEQNNIITISTHKHGCCVLQKLLSVCTLQQIFKISVKIVQFLPGLINDQFGNYIIQFLLDIKELDFYLLAELFNRLSNELCQLSCLKFSSNVVEKFIKKLFRIITGFIVNNNGGASQRTAVASDDVINASMNILLTTIDIFTVNLNVLIRDNFGNYALQTLLDVKNYSPLLAYNKNGNAIGQNSSSTLNYGNFCNDFSLKIGNLIVLTKELLPSIKTTSYAKKIKLKVKAYAEATGIPFTDISPQVTAMSHNNLQTINNENKNPHNKNSHNHNHNHNHNHAHNNNNNNNQKSHTRHFSLPANAYHRRSNSSVTNNFSNQYAQDQKIHSPQQIMNFNQNAYPSMGAPSFNSQTNPPLVSHNSLQNFDNRQFANLMAHPNSAAPIHSFSSSNITNVNPNVSRGFKQPGFMMNETDKINANHFSPYSNANSQNFNESFVPRMQYQTEGANWDSSLSMKSQHIGQGPYNQVNMSRNASISNMPAMNTARTSDELQFTLP